MGAVPVAGSVQPQELYEGWGWEVLATHRALEQLWDDCSQHRELLHTGRAWDSMSTLQLCPPRPDGAWRKSRVTSESQRVEFFFFFSLSWELCPERHKTKMLHHRLQAGELT